MNLNRILKYLAIAIVSTLTLIVLGLVTLFIVNYAILPVVTSGEITTVPDITGMLLPEALDTLYAHSLTPDTGGSRYSEFPEGTVLETSPPPGMKVKAGRRVKLVVSRGTHKVKVPDVIGMDFQLASQLIEREGLVIGYSEYTFSEHVSQNRVVEILPSPGTELEPGDTVRLAISLGKLELEEF